VTWLIRVCDMTHSYMWHDSFVYVTWLIRICDMTHSCVWHDSFVYVTWLIRICDMTHSFMWHDFLVYVTWLPRKCDMTYLYVTRLIFFLRLGSFRIHKSGLPTWPSTPTCHDSFVYGTWLIRIVTWLISIRIRVCDMTYLLWCHIYATWLIYVTRLFMWRGSFTIYQPHCPRDHPPWHVMTHSYI